MKMKVKLPCILSSFLYESESNFHSPAVCSKLIIILKRKWKSLAFLRSVNSKQMIIFSLTFIQNFSPLITIYKKIPYRYNLEPGQIHFINSPNIITFSPGVNCKQNKNYHFSSDLHSELASSLITVYKKIPPLQSTWPCPSFLTNFMHFWGHVQRFK